MNMTKLYVTITLLILYQTATGQDAYSTGTGRANTASVSLYQVYHNQAGLAELQSVYTGLYSALPHMLSELSSGGVAAAVPVKGGVLGFMIQYDGFKLFNRKKAGLAFAKAFSETFRAGIQVDYLSLNIDEYGSRSVITGEGGIQAAIHAGLTLGAHLFNPLNILIGEYQSEYFPTIMQIGMEWDISEKIDLLADINKETGYPFSIEAGINYQPVNKISLQSGIKTNPLINTFGMGFFLKDLHIHIAGSVHPLLGITPHFSLNYEIRKDK